MEKLIRIADTLIEKAKAAGAQAAQCSVSDAEKKEFNVDGGEFSLMRTLFDRGVSLSIIKDGKYGAVAGNQFSEEALEKLVNEAVAAAESAEPDPARAFCESGEHLAFTDGALQCDTEKLFVRTKELLDTIGSEYPKLLVEQMITEHTYTKTVYRNSYGTAYENERGAYAFYVGYSAHEGESGSHSFGSSAVLRDLDRPFIECGLTRTELADTEAQAVPQPLTEKFTGTVVFTPGCLADVVFGTIMDSYVADRALIEGTSTWKDRIGEKIADERITLRIAPGDPRIVCGQRYTGEGFPVVDFDLIRDGVLQGFCLSQYGANKTGGVRSGNQSGTLVSPAGDVPFAEIIAGIERGIVIGRFSGGRPGANGEFSGVAKNSFLIEDGKITKALSETMISANLNEMLLDLAAVSRETLDDGTMSVPFMAFNGVTISGK